MEQWTRTSTARIPTRTPQHNKFGQKSYKYCFPNTHKTNLMMSSPLQSQTSSRKRPRVEEGDMQSTSYSSQTLPSIIYTMPSLSPMSPHVSGNSFLDFPVGFLPLPQLLRRDHYPQPHDLNCNHDTITQIRCTLPDACTPIKSNLAMIKDVPNDVEKFEKHVRECSGSISQWTGDEGLSYDSESLRIIHSRSSDGISYASTFHVEEDSPAQIPRLASAQRDDIEQTTGYTHNSYDLESSLKITDDSRSSDGISYSSTFQEEDSLIQNPKCKTVQSEEIDEIAVFDAQYPSKIPPIVSQNDEKTYQEQKARTHFLHAVRRNADFVVHNANMMRKIVYSICHQNPQDDDFMSPDLASFDSFDQQMQQPYSGAEGAEYFRMIAMNGLINSETNQDAYEQERVIATVIEPRCFAMQQISNGIEPINDLDETEGRWYAQTSRNIDGIYYYQPSTGALSRSVPFEYMDTSDVRRLAESITRNTSSTSIDFLRRCDCNVNHNRLIRPLAKLSRTKLSHRRYAFIMAIVAFCFIGCYNIGTKYDNLVCQEFCTPGMVQSNLFRRDPRDFPATTAIAADKFLPKDVFLPFLETRQQQQCAVVEGVPTTLLHLPI